MVVDDPHAALRVQGKQEPMVLDRVGVVPQMVENPYTVDTETRAGELGARRDYRMDRGHEGCKERVKGGELGRGLGLERTLSLEDGRGVTQRKTDP
jgi:hypothetical protein